jgi:thiol:disulfide interchange protein
MLHKARKFHNSTPREPNRSTISAQVGLLPRDNEEQIPFAFKMYQKTSAAGIQMAAGYKQTFCQNVQVEFLGVWCVSCGVLEYLIFCCKLTLED